MLPQQIAAAVGRVVREQGETMTLHRAGATPLALKGKRVMGATEDSGGSAVQQRFRVRIGVAELQASAWSPPEPSAATDTILIGGRERTILDVRPALAGEVVALYELEVAG